MQLKGIVKGKTIEFLEPVTIPEGIEVLINIPDNYLDKKSQWDELEKVIGVWENDEEITQIFAQINQERHLDYGRDVNFDNEDQ
jgi:hypothetical protein